MQPCKNRRVRLNRQNFSCDKCLSVKIDNKQAFNSIINVFKIYKTIFQNSIRYYPIDSINRTSNLLHYHHLPWSLNQTIMIQAYYSPYLISFKCKFDNSKLKLRMLKRSWSHKEQKYSNYIARSLELAISKLTLLTTITKKRWRD